MIIERKESVTQFRERSVTQNTKAGTGAKTKTKTNTHTQTMAKEDSFLRGQSL